MDICITADVRGLQHTPLLVISSSLSVIWRISEMPISLPPHFCDCPFFLPTHRSSRPSQHFRRSCFRHCGPTVWNSLPDSLRDPAVGPDQFRRDLKTYLFEWHCISFSALAVFSHNALYRSTFYLLTYYFTYYTLCFKKRPHFYFLITLSYINWLL